jgi:hypothetical protein
LIDFDILVVTETHLDNQIKDSKTFPLVKSLRIYPIYIGYLNSIRHHAKKGA